jgi:NhaP-type Na+/H+ or K+/H+ antiporter
MEPVMSAHALVVTLALIGAVILVASLLSGAVERTGIPQVIVFLALGAAVGPWGLGVVDFGLRSPWLYVVATLGLVLVLFSDAISVDLREVRRNARLALLVLGPGTLATAALIAVAGWWLLHLPPAAAAVLGAALSSTDPVLLRGLLRRGDLPADARLALRLESGMNDVVLLPIILVGMLFLRPADTTTTGEMGRLGVGLFLLGPGAGVLAGLVAITLLERVRGRVGVRRDYESLYALGVAFTAYAAAESAGGSGLLAAFAAGLTVAALDVELCDCFLDYGQATAEMFLLLTFVAFGASLIWSGLTIVTAATLAFAALALTVRTLVMIPVLRHAGLERRSCHLIAWFGPRGLSTLLLVLLPVFAGLPGSERLFTIACLVVLLSVLFHGGAIAFLARPAAAPRPVTSSATSTAVTAANVAPPAAARPVVGATASGRADGRTIAPSAPVPERITLDELRSLWQAGAPVVLADVRTARAYAEDPRRARGALRIPPDDAVREAVRLNLPRDATIALFCA